MWFELLPKSQCHCLKGNIVMRGADAPRGEDMSEAPGEGGDLRCNGGYFIRYNRDSANLDPQGAQRPAKKVSVGILCVSLGIGGRMRLSGQMGR